MWSYILGRLFFGIPTLLGVTIIVFTLLHLAPGDPMNAMVPPDAPLELVQMIRQQMGLDQPLPPPVLALADPGSTWGSGQLAGNPSSRAAGNPCRPREHVSADHFRGVSRLYDGASVRHHGGILPGAGGSTKSSEHGDHWRQPAATTSVSIMLILIFSVTLNWLPAMGMQEYFREFVSMDTRAAYDPPQSWPYPSFPWAC